jgi:hypothetical protein
MKCDWNFGVSDPFTTKPPTIALPGPLAQTAMLPINSPIRGFPPSLGLFVEMLFNSYGHGARRQNGTSGKGLKLSVLESPPHLRVFTVELILPLLGKVV